MVILCLLGALCAAALLQRITAAGARREPAAVPRAAWVYEVRGAVAEDGFYFFPEAQRFDQLLRACGGLQPGPQAGVVCDYQAPVPNGSRVTVGERVEIAPLPAAVRLVFFLPVCLNTASAEELACIPGIGLKTAEAIIAYRDARNGIQDIQELRSIKGIGAQRIGACAPYLTTEDCF